MDPHPERPSLPSLSFFKRKKNSDPTNRFERKCYFLQRKIIGQCLFLFFFSFHRILEADDIFFYEFFWNVSKLASVSGKIPLYQLGTRSSRQQQSKSLVNVIPTCQTFKWIGGLPPLGLEYSIRYKTSPHQKGRRPSGMIRPPFNVIM